MFRLSFLAILCLLAIPLSAQDEVKQVKITSFDITVGKPVFMIEVDGQTGLVAENPIIMIDHVPSSIGELVDYSISNTGVTFEIVQDPYQYNAVTEIHCSKVVHTSTQEATEEWAIVYETRTICENGVCRQVRVPIRKLIKKAANATKALVAPLATCPCGCGIAGCTCGMAPNVVVESFEIPATGMIKGNPPPGYHQHMDSQGNVWEHHDSNSGYYAPHVSPFTGEVVYDRYAEGTPTYRPFNRVRGTIQGIRGRWGLRRQGRFTMLEKYSLTGERSYPLLSAIMPKAWLSLTL